MLEGYPKTLENINNKQPKDLRLIRRGERGTDDAVVEIGSDTDKELLNNILTDPTNHSRDELLSAIFQNYSGDAYGDAQWHTFTGGWTTPKETTQYGKMRDEHPEFAALSLDSGFMTHLPEFMDMIEQGEIKSTGPIAAREELKEKLGYKIMWRGTMLADDELESVKNTGLMSPLSMIVKSSNNPEEQFEGIALSTYANDATERHFHGEHRSTPLISVSGYKDVAIAVGRHFGDKSPEKKFYLLKLGVPVIDLISYKEHAIRTPAKLKSIKDYNPEYSLSISLDDKKAEYKWDEEVESYMFWKINPEEIIEITQPDVSESTWNNGRVTRMPNN